VTSSTDTDEHPEVMEISALAEGLLPPDRTVHVRGHLAACELCSEVRASLDEIRSLLGTLPGPVQMPADIAGRIDAALAAEALLDATTPDDRVDVSRETSTPEAETDPAPSVSRETSEPTRPRQTLGEATPISSGSAERPAGRPRAATGPGRGKSRPDTRRQQARRWPRAVLGTACAAAVIGLGSFIIQSGSTQGNDAASTQTAKRQPSSAADTLSAATLQARVHALLADQKSSTASGDVRAQDTPDMPLRAEDPPVPDCVQEGTGRSEVPLAAQEDTYAGKDVYLVVLPHRADSKLVDAFVIDSACVAQSPSTAGTRLVAHTYPRD
jgi:negative regulator of sigma E activity